MPQYWQPSGYQKKTLRQALVNSFSYQDISILVSDYFSPESFQNINPPGGSNTLEYQFQNLIEHARMNSWLVDLVAAAHERRPNDPDLTSLADELGLTVTGSRLDNPTGTPFQQVVQQNAQMINIADFIQKAAKLANMVCWVDVPGGGGTGFLVGPDLILTNYHVVKSVEQGQVQSKDVRCRFDYKQAIDGSTLSLKKLPEVALKSPSWLVDKLPPSPCDENPALGNPSDQELDYALLRLVEPFGEMPVGGDTVDSVVKDQPRGWINTSEAPAPLIAGNQVFLLQHPWAQPQVQPPRPEPLTLSIGSVLQFNANGTRVRYDANTRDGASGCPCFNADLQLVALHHAHEPVNHPSWNQAIPFSMIKQAWTQKGIVLC
jgi:hypothetical protein